MGVGGSHSRNMIDMSAWDNFNSGDGSFDALAKKDDALYPCLKNFLEVKLKRFILITLTK